MKRSIAAGSEHGFHYVVNPSIEVKRVEYVNADLLPGHPFYAENAARGLDVAGFLAAVRNHEGLGGGKPGTGHSQIIHDELAKPTGDPRRVLETVAAPTEQALQQKADAKLTAIDGRIDGASNDPLPVIWSGSLVVQDSYTSTWRQATIHVP